MASPDLSHDSFTLVMAQLNPTLGDLESNFDKITASVQSVERYVADSPRDLNANHVVICFSELITSGYPPEDLVLKACFLDDIERKIEQLCDRLKDFKGCILVSTPWRDNRSDGAASHPEDLAEKPYNAVLAISSGAVIGVYKKRHLPNYGVFDEKRVFEASPDLPDILQWQGHKIGIMTCEDLWHDDVSAHLAQQNAEILIIPNGSPFDMNKVQTRRDIAASCAKKHQCALAYINQVGGQDELVFDGGSFLLDQDGTPLYQAEFFEEQLVLNHLVKNNNTEWSAGFSDTISVDKTIDKPKIVNKNKELADVSNTSLEHIYEALVLGLRDYVRKNGFKSILLGLSGGIDSALAAVIAVDAIGAEHVHCVMMPTEFTSQMSLDDAKQLAENLGCRYDIQPITSHLEQFEKALGDDVANGLAHENIQSRLRGLTLMALSNHSGAMVLSTGNKSELAVGYATLYGDMCGGFNALKDVYKTQVFALARMINEQSGERPLIPERIITRPPSAELRPDQKDEDSLPPYDVLDQILHGLIEEQLGLEPLMARGFKKEDIVRIWRLLDRAEYKRYQSPPGVKITSKAFGRDRRIPMTNRYQPKD